MPECREVCHPKPFDSGAVDPFAVKGVFAMNFRISSHCRLISIVMLLTPGCCISASVCIAWAIVSSSKICIASFRGMRPFLTSARYNAIVAVTARHGVSRVIEFVVSRVIEHTNAPIGYGWHPVAFAGTWGGAYWKMVRFYHTASACNSRPCVLLSRLPRAIDAVALAMRSRQQRASSTLSRQRASSTVDDGDQRAVRLERGKGSA